MNLATTLLRQLELDGKREIRPPSIFHRRGDTVFPVYRKEIPDSPLKVVDYIHVVDMTEQLSLHASALQQDSYYAINGYWRPGTRLAEDLRSLNAAYVDLDYDSGISFFQAMERADQLVDEGILPPPSVYVRSGTGAWLFWRLGIVGDLDYPPDAKLWQRALLQRINRKIVELIKARMPELQPDPSCTDPARITRFEGSINSKSPLTPVRYFEDGRKPTYTLEQLAEFLGVPILQPAENFAQPKRLRLVDDTEIAPRFAVKNPDAKPRSSTGWVSLYQGRLEEFRLLWAHRGGFHAGARNHAAFVYAVLLLGLSQDEEQITAEMETLGRECVPPLSAGEITAKIKAAKKKNYKLTNVEISQRLAVTPEEIDHLRLTRLVPDFVPKNPDAHVNKGRNGNMKLRRDEVVRIVLQAATDDKPQPSLRKIQAELKELGFSCSHRTVKLDLEARGLPTSKATEPEIEPTLF